MNSGLSISLAVFCFFFAAVLFSICYIQLRKRHWPLIEGVVIAQRYRRSHGIPAEDTDQARFDSSNEQMSKIHDVQIMLNEKNYELSFANLPVSTAIGDKLLVQVHPLLPQFLYDANQKTRSNPAVYLFNTGLMGSFAVTSVALGWFFAKLAYS